MQRPERERERKKKLNHVALYLVVALGCHYHAGDSKVK